MHHRAEERKRSFAWEGRSHEGIPVGLSEERIARGLLPLLNVNVNVNAVIVLSLFISLALLTCDVTEAAGTRKGCELMK